MPIDLMALAEGGAPEPSRAAHMESVSLSEVPAVSANYLQPWKMHGQRQSSGSGALHLSAGSEDH